MVVMKIKAALAVHGNADYMSPYTGKTGKVFLFLCFNIKLVSDLHLILFFVDDGKFKDAVNKYKDALSKAESSVSKSK